MSESHFPCNRGILGCRELVQRLKKLGIYMLSSTVVGFATIRIKNQIVWLVLISDGIIG